LTVLRRHYGEYRASKLCHLVIMAGNFQDVFVSEIYDRNFGGFDPVYLENVVNHFFLFFKWQCILNKYLCCFYVNYIYHIRVSGLILALDKTPFLQPVIFLYDDWHTCTFSQMSLVSH
jgi:hypothetical protein